MNSTKKIDSLRRKLQETYDYYEKLSATGLIPYLNSVVIDSRPEPKSFRELGFPWQWSLNSHLAPALEYIAGVRPTLPKYRNFFISAVKGADKSSMVARDVNWALAFCQKPFVGYVAAADKEQAGYLLDAMNRESSLNPWLRRHLQFKNWSVEGANGSVVHVLASDAASTQGIRGDLIVLDELSHWKRRDLFDHVMSGREKRYGSCLIIITNAGEKRTWPYEVREMARLSPSWWYYEMPPNLASWMDDKAKAELRKMLPAPMAKRLFDNIWVDPGESCGYITREECEACLELGAEMNLAYRTQGKPGTQYVIGVDYGAVRDRCVLTVLHAEKEVVVIDRMDVWQGSRDNPVKIEAVERWLDEIRNNFHVVAAVVDPWQMESTCQRYQGLLPIIKWEARGGKTNFVQAQVFRAAVVNKKLAWYEGCGTIYEPGKPAHTFIDELVELYIKSVAGGYRVQHYEGSHDDRFVSCAMALHHLQQTQLRKPLYLSDHFF